MSSSTMLFASGWKIPEQSANSTALSGAYIANAMGADSAYYNPANMSFNPDKNQLTLSLLGVSLGEIDFKDSNNSNNDGSSKKENVLIPTAFFTSKDYDGIRYGLSFTAPGGLSKRWDEAYSKTFAEEFTLRILELNPVVSYKLKENLSIAAGFRLLYTDGVVKSEGSALGPLLKREMEGDTFTYGYNLALAYKMNENSNFSMTYRSNIDIKVEGTSQLYLNNTKLYDGGANVEIPLPAALNVAYAHKFGDTTVELVVEKTYWSKYKALDFEYDNAVHPALVAVFDDPSEKNWKDSVAKRIGITHQYNDELKLMFGFAIDEAAAPANTLSFELPDTDAKIYSLGYEYKLDNDSSYSLGYLYSKKEERKSTSTLMDGDVSDSDVHILAFSYKMSF